LAALTEAERIAYETIHFWRRQGVPAKCVYYALTGSDGHPSWDRVFRIMVRWENARFWRLIEPRAS
jgi:hypothetical protein